MLISLSLIYLFFIRVSTVHLAVLIQNHAQKAHIVLLKACLVKPSVDLVNLGNSVPDWDSQPAPANARKDSTALKDQ